MLLELNFLQFQSKLRLLQSGNTGLIYDPIRKKNVVRTPEETLRQLVLLYLLEVMQYPSRRIRVEIGIELHGMKKRCDIVVFDKNLSPWLLIECKSPKVKLAQSTFDQAAAYNLQLQVPYLAVTNGLATFCCAMDYELRNYRFLEHFPELETE